MNITLNPDLESLITAEVEAGRSSNLEEFLNKAVYHYVVARDLGQEYSSEEIDRLIAEGLGDIDRGNTIEGEVAFQQLRSHSAERRRQRA